VIIDSRFEGIQPGFIYDASRGADRGAKGAEAPQLLEQFSE